MLSDVVLTLTWNTSVSSKYGLQVFFFWRDCKCLRSSGSKWSLQIESVNILIIFFFTNNCSCFCWYFIGKVNKHSCCIFIETSVSEFYSRQYYLSWRIDVTYLSHLFLTRKFDIYVYMSTKKTCNYKELRNM